MEKSDLGPENNKVESVDVDVDDTVKDSSENIKSVSSERKGD